MNKTKFFVSAGLAAIAVAGFFALEQKLQAKEVAQTEESQPLQSQVEDEFDPKTVYDYFTSRAACIYVGELAMVIMESYQIGVPRERMEEISDPLNDWLIDQAYGQFLFTSKEGRADIIHAFREYAIGECMKFI